MGDRRFTRREALETAGVAALGGVLGMASSAVAEGSWTRVDAPGGKMLTGVEQTATVPHASGGGGRILRRDARDGWTVVLSDGPGGNGKALTGASVTTDGNRYWVSGNSGVIGEYDVETGEIVDHSQPYGISNEFTSIFVRGTVGNELVMIGEASGTLLIGERTDTGEMDWRLSDTGSGYTIETIDISTLTGSAFVGTNGGGVFRTDDGGNSWVDVSPKRAETGYTAILVDERGPEQVFVGGGAGRILRRDCDCGLWTPEKIDSKRIYSLEANNQDERYLGAGGSGRYYERSASEEGAGWKARKTPTGNALLCSAPADSDDGIDFLVGSGGTILER